MTSPRDSSEQRASTEALDILWTGGWDSTFRVLQATLVEGHPVKPYYLIDVERDSTLQELRAIARIRKEANARCGAERIQPVTYASRADLKPDPTVARLYRSLTERMHAGAQYEWLAQFARAQDLHALELAIEKYPPEMASDLYKLLQANTSGHGHACAVTSYPVEALRLFDRYRFPVLHLTKDDMEQVARQEGFDDVMDHTWSCHQPVLGQPCGKCRPCVIARRNGRPLGGARRAAARDLVRIAKRLTRRYLVAPF